MLQKKTYKNINEVDHKFLITDTNIDNWGLWI